MAWALLLMLGAGNADPPLQDFEVSSLDGRSVRVSSAEGRQATVVVFLNVDCPMAKLYAPRLQELSKRFPGARFLAVNSSEQDDGAAIAAFARRHGLEFPCFKDPGGRVAELLGAVHSPHAFVLDSERRVRYRGRIDDQFARGGKNRGQPTREDLAEALREVLTRRPVSVPSTETTGCALSRPQPAVAASPINYSQDIAPILARECRQCHQPGEVAPFPLLTYADARNHAETLAAVVEDGTMPPWHAAPEFGKFRNERRLNSTEKRLIADWVRLGCPAGPTIPASSTMLQAIGRPDAVFPIPKEFAVPAQGRVEYQHFFIDPGLTSDVWVCAAEVRPGNRQVVHHCTVFISPPGSTGINDVVETGSLGSHCLIAFTPGSGPVMFPEGMAKRIPAGCRLHFVIHYVATGSPQTDRTELAVRFVARSQVRREVATKLIHDPDLRIPPLSARYSVEKTWTADRNCLLLAMLPHMHLRGKSFRFAAEYPDGTREVLLDVPAYDFNWQHRYELAEPKRLPAGTVVRCTAIYDNSAANPNNPDPAVTVLAGEQTQDEMFNGYLDIAEESDLPPEPVPVLRLQAGMMLATTLAATGWWCWRLRGRSRFNRAAA